MATKAEQQAAHDRCEQVRRNAAAAEQLRDYPLAVQRASAAFPDLHAAVSFQRRYLKPPAVSTPAMDVILRCAPPFFLVKALDAVQEWYGGGTKTERAALPDVPAKVDAARKVLAHAVELWGVLAESPGAVLRPPLTPLTGAVVPLWVSAGVVAPRPQERNTYARVSDSRRPAVAKCSACGRERTAPLTDLLAPATCPSCQRRCHFVLVRRALGGVA